MYKRLPSLSRQVRDTFTVYDKKDSKFLPVKFTNTEIIAISTSNVLHHYVFLLSFQNQSVPVVSHNYDQKHCI